MYTYDPDKPGTIAQALRSPHAAEFWQALLTEIERLIAMGTFEAYLGPLSDIDPLVPFYLVKPSLNWFTIQTVHLKNSNAV
jgi:hypothetical protein